MNAAEADALVRMLTVNAMRVETKDEGIYLVHCEPCTRVSLLPYQLIPDGIERSVREAEGRALDERFESDQ